MKVHPSAAMPTDASSQSAPGASLRGSHAPGTPDQSFSTLVELAELRAREAAERIAYTFLEDGERLESSISYAELDRRARIVAAHLQQAGATGQRALLIYPPGLDYITAFFGCLYAGVVAVPVYPPDPARLGRTLSRLQTIARDARAGFALTTEAVLALARPLLEQAQDLAALRWLSTDGLTDALASAWQRPAIGPDTLAFLQYTSGSTGAPKGVMLSHANLIANQRLIHEGFGQGPQSVVLGWLPLYHDMGLIGTMLGALHAGARSVLMSPLAFLQRPLRWLQAVTRYRATASGGPNFAYDLCARRITAEERATLDLGSWEVAFSGAEPVRAGTLERFADIFAPCGFRREAFYPCYGLAEATLFVSGRSRQDAPRVKVRSFRKQALARNTLEDCPASEQAHALVGCGRGLGDGHIAIVDPETGQPLGPGRIGEVWVRGQSVARGYWQNPVATEATFGARLAGSAEGPFLRTGDLGAMLEGELFITGRRKDLIILRGRNHYPQDIEHTVERCHPALRPGCGAAFSVDVDGEERLAIAHEVDPRKAPDLAELTAIIRDAVAREHEVQVHTVALLAPRALPKTSSGKVQRRTCRAELLAGTLELVNAPSVLQSALPAAPAAPAAPAGVQRSGALPRTRAEVESWLAALLGERLRLPPGQPNQIAPHQPLLRYGLDSLAAAELQGELEQRLDVVVPMQELLGGVSLQQLVDRVLSATPATDQPAPVPQAPSAQASTPQPLSPQADEAGAAPLSRGQRALWLFQQSAPDSPAYHVTGAVRVRGGLDVAALRASLQQLVDRHASLRTTFPGEGGQPRQHIAPRGTLLLDEEDGSAWSVQELQERLREAAFRPFDLERGPLLQVLLVHHPDGPVLLWVMHHIITDFWSISVLLHEWSALYAAARTGARADLPPPANTHADFVRWQEKRLAGEAGESLASAWQERLAAAPTLLQLPMDRPPPAHPRHRAGVAGLSLDAALAARVRAVGAAHGATPSMTLLAAFQVLLHRYTGQPDFLVGVPSMGRERAAWSGVVGYFVNPLPVRARLADAPSFSALLQRVRQDMLDTLALQHYPFASLVERLRPAHSPGRPGLLQALFMLQKAPSQQQAGQQTGPQAGPQAGLSRLALGQGGSRLRLGELALEEIALGQVPAPFELSLIAAEEDQDIALALHYSLDLFEPQTAVRLLENYRTLLTGLLAHPERPVGRASMLSPAELHRLLTTWNDTRAPFPDFCLHELFEQQAARTPDAPAVLHAQERHTQGHTYDQINRRANRLARHLRSMGVCRETLVGVCMDRSPDMVVGLLAILKAGAAYVPLDPDYPSERLALIVQDSGLSVLLTTRRRRERLPLGPDMQVLCVDETHAALARLPDDDLPRTTDPDGVAYVLYTSGSTGVPKGVRGLHRGAVNRFQWMWDAYPFEPGELSAQKTSLNFGDSIWEIFGPLLRGCPIAIIPQEQVVDPEALVDALAAHGATRLVLVPSLLRALLSLDMDLPARLPRLRLWVTSGEAISAELCQAFHQRLPGRRLLNLYGSSELSADVSAYDTAAARPGAPVPIGRPIANTRLYLLDANLNPVPLGAPGELYVGGVGLARDYLNRPGLTAERFIPDPFGDLPGARLFRTGDIARYQADGNLAYLGRADHQVKVRGYRIEPGEIELALRQHPGVEEAVVVAHEARGDLRLIAYVVPRAGGLTAGALRDALRQKLPPYMVPAAFVLLEAMPRTPSGKIDRRGLPVPQAAESPAGSPTSERIAPRTPEEQIVADIFAEVLGLAQVGVHDDFFDLGGHSLLATQVVARVRARFQIELPLRVLFDVPTVAGIAAVVGAQGDAVAQSPALQRIEPSEAALLERLDELSEDELDALLARESMGLDGEEGDV